MSRKRRKRKKNKQSYVIYESKAKDYNKVNIDKINKKVSIIKEHPTLLSDASILKEFINLEIDNKMVINPVNKKQLYSLNYEERIELAQYIGITLESLNRLYSEEELLDKFNEMEYSKAYSTAFDSSSASKANQKELRITETPYTELIDNTPINLRESYMD